MGTIAHTHGDTLYDYPYPPEWDRPDDDLMDHPPAEAQAYRLREIARAAGMEWTDAELGAVIEGFERPVRPLALYGCGLFVRWARPYDVQCFVRDLAGDRWPDLTVVPYG